MDDKPHGAEPDDEDDEDEPTEDEMRLEAEMDYARDARRSMRGGW